MIAELALLEERIQRGYPPCRGCGCNDYTACPGGCSWIQPDLCSECDPDARLADERPDVD